MSRSQKTGSDLELQIMAGISRTLKRLAPESRNRVVNWVAAQDWADEKPPADTRQTTIPTLS